MSMVILTLLGEIPVEKMPIRLSGVAPKFRDCFFIPVMKTFAGFLPQVTLFYCFTDHRACPLIATKVRVEIILQTLKHIQTIPVLML